MKLFLIYLWIIGGAITTLVGLGLVWMYLQEAVFLRAGDPDQSLLFWYLPLLFLGLIVFAAGMALLAKGFCQLREKD